MTGVATTTAALVGLVLAAVLLVWAVAAVLVLGVGTALARAVEAGRRR